MAENLLTLIMLIALQAVLGFDNLLYITLEAKRAPKERQAFVRNMGIGLAVVLRIVLLFILLSLVEKFKDPLLHLNWTDIVEGELNLHALIELLGGVFIIYTAVKEIIHMLAPVDLEQHERKPGSVVKIITMIVLMNLVFSFDSILSAMALTEVFWIMAAAIVIGGILMIWLAGRVAAFLEKNRMYEVLGLFILLVVGIMLLTEGGHIGHLELFGNPITPMSKTTFYFVIVVMVLSDIVQSGYQKKLMAQRARKK